MDDEPRKIDLREERWDPPVEVTPPESHTSERMNRMYKYQQEYIMDDVMIKVDGCYIQAHSIVLASASTYFHNMFVLDIWQRNEGQVQLDQFSYSTMMAIVKFMYCQPIQVCSPRELEELLEASVFFDLQCLQDRVLQMLLTETTSENFSPIVNMLIRFRLCEKREAMLAIHSNSKAFYDSDDFKSLSFTDLVHLIGHTDRFNRDNLLIACIEWVKHNVEHRLVKIVDLLEAIKPETCSLLAMQSIVSNNKELISSNENIHNRCLDVIMDLKHLERSEMEYLLLIGVLGLNGNKHVHSWLKMSHEWEVFTDIPIEVNDGHFPPSVAVMPGGYALMNAGPLFSSNVIFDIPNDRYLPMPDPPKRLLYSTAAFLDNHLFMLGGTPDIPHLDKNAILKLFFPQKAGCSSIVYYFSFELWKWVNAPSMLEKQCSPIAATSKDSIYVVYNELNKKLDKKRRKKDVTLQALSKSSDRWVFKASLPAKAPKCEAAAMTHVEGMLYLLGGRSKLAACYTISTDNWSLLSQPFLGFDNRAMYVSNGLIYLCGGNCTFNQAVSAIEEYDPEQDIWKICIAKLPVALTLGTIGFINCLPGSKED